METFSSVEAKNSFGDVVQKAQQEPVCITKNNKPTAVMISMKEFENFQALREQLLHQRLDRALEDVEAGRGIDGKDAFKELMDLAND